MPLTADQIRELAARPEGSALDFKVSDYDWSKPAKASSNVELTKDLMAMANLLGPNTGAAYILVGVRNDGTIVGVPPGSHQDDAALHQKVQGILNRTPSFSYGHVDVDGYSVGVYEIRAGGRPFFPLKSAPPLVRHVAYYRNGSATDEASPTMIIEWAREDDADAHALRLLERRRREAEAKVMVALSHTNVTTTGHHVAIDLLLQNVGRPGVTIEAARWRVVWTPRFDEALARAGTQLPPSYQPPAGTLRVLKPGLLRAEEAVSVNFRWERQQALDHLKAAQVAVEGFGHEWADYVFEIDCDGELGGRKTARVHVRASS